MESDLLLIGFLKKAFGSDGRHWGHIEGRSIEMIAPPRKKRLKQ
jgi:hypothetical protein